MSNREEKEEYSDDGYDDALPNKDSMPSIDAEGPKQSQNESSNLVLNEETESNRQRRIDQEEEEEAELLME